MLLLLLTVLFYFAPPTTLQLSQPVLWFSLVNQHVFVLGPTIFISMCVCVFLSSFQFEINVY